MDDGSVRSFTAYRVHHTLTMGPTKGGLRYARGVSQGVVTTTHPLRVWPWPTGTGRASANRSIWSSSPGR